MSNIETFLNKYNIELNKYNIINDNKYKLTLDFDNDFQIYSFCRYINNKIDIVHIFNDELIEYQEDIIDDTYKIFECYIRKNKLKKIIK